MNDKPTYDVTVIGSGPTGATAANLLGRLGLNVVIIERDADVLNQEVFTRAGTGTARPHMVASGGSVTGAASLGRVGGYPTKPRQLRGYYDTRRKNLGANHLSGNQHLEPASLLRDEDVPALAGAEMRIIDR